MLLRSPYSIDDLPSRIFGGAVGGVDDFGCDVKPTPRCFSVPMTVLMEDYWREISSGLAAHAIPVRHFVLHADTDTLRARIQGDTVMGPSAFRFQYVEPFRYPSRTSTRLLAS